MRRLAAVGVLAGMVGAVLVPAAQAEDLEDYLHAAATASYSGRQIIVTEWDGETAFGSYQVSQRPGMTVVHGAGEDVGMGDGVLATKKGGKWYGLAVERWADWKLHERYSMGDLRELSPLGRPATSVDVLESGMLRARLVFDVETSAPLRAEWFDADGVVYRFSILVEFSAEAGPPEAPEMSRDDESYPVMTAAVATELPAAVAGYWRADAYDGPEYGTHVFYTDGLFSFSVFALPDRVRSGPFADAHKFKVEGETYRRLIEPGAVWVYWSTPDRTYVLVGDLPPDHLDQVLAELPEPGVPNLFVRLWRNLFG